MKLDVEAMAREAGMNRSHHPSAYVSDYAECVFVEHLEAFARLIVERCAVECEKLREFYEEEKYKHEPTTTSGAFRDGEETGSEACAAAIRNLLED